MSDQIIGAGAAQGLQAYSQRPFPMVVAALRAARIIQPGAAVIERIAIAGQRVPASGRPVLW